MTVLLLKRTGALQPSSLAFTVIMLYASDWVVFDFNGYNSNGY